MKLSDALVLGITQTTFNPYNWNHCLIGVAFHAVAGLEANICIDGSGWPTEAYARWPWLEQKVRTPEHLLGHGYKSKASFVLSSLAIRARKGEISFEQVLEWIRSVEPDEPQTEQEDANAETILAL